MFCSEIVGVWLEVRGLKGKQICVQLEERNYTLSNYFVDNKYLQGADWAPTGL